MYSGQYNIKQGYTHQMNTLFSTQQNKLNSIQQIQTISQLKDTIISMQYRIKIIQQQINSKMQRQQCLILMQRKSNTNHVKKFIDEIYHKIQSQKQLQQKQRQKLAQSQQLKINQMKKKLKNININHNNNTKNLTQLITSPTHIKQNPILFTSHNNNNNNNNTNFPSQLQKITNKINKVLIQPQQLYLQSNQTMFSMLIDQIKQLKARDSIIQRLIQNKHKKNVSLNNQVCRKLEFLENSIQETIKYIDQINNNSKNYNNGNNYENKLKKGKKNASTSVKHIHQNKSFNNNPIPNNSYLQQKQKVFSTLSNPNQAFQSIRIQLLSKSVQSLQRQLSTKINIKDLVPFIKQNLLPYDQSLNQIRQYVQQNFESTRKILTNQSEINQEISNVNKLAWWHMYEREDNYMVFNREIMNIIPEVLIVQTNSNIGQAQHSHITLKVMTQGWYLIQCYTIQHNIQISSQNQSSNRNNQINNNIHNINNIINNINQYQQKSSRTISHIQMQVNSTIRYTILKQKLINFTAGTEIRFLANVQDLFLKIQKL